ncbi:MAG: hypothetical protein GYB53_10330 [Rhodobacteraceae bacterium]|nr:hypothetical protein [Paracoccaceae bacterium]MBR9820706.1 hypothetical protein [Paracoccaceae bacterium]
MDREAGTFTLQLATWHNTYPLETLDRWLEFYREQRSIFSKCRDTYDETIELLEKAVAERDAA